MISIIVCSVNKDLLEKLRNNIAATTGVNHEMLVTDNSIGQRPIADVYNEAAEKARFPFLCFVHEDVIIHTSGWGREIINLLEQKQIGLVGISGAVYKSKYPGSWAACDSVLYRTHSIQHFKDKAEPVVININPLHAGHAEVAVIDGVFMATRSDVFKQYRFDSALLKGFHGYDIDYSLQVGQQYKVVVTYGLLLEHLSAGSYSDDWIDSNIKVHQKWKKHLPKTVINDHTGDRRSDYISCSSVLQNLLVMEDHRLLVLKYYLLVLFFFFDKNKFRFTKTVLRYLILNK